MFITFLRAGSGDILVTNKLGDPDKNVPLIVQMSRSKVSLPQGVVAAEVQRLMFRSNVSERVALYVLWEARYREAREEREREREKRLHSPFALHAPIQWAIQGYVIKKRG